jgi:hypothetical protein
MMMMMMLMLMLMLLLLLLMLLLLLLLLLLLGSTFAFPGTGAYNVSKAGVDMLTKAAAIELAPSVSHYLILSFQIQFLSRIELD